MVWFAHAHEMYKRVPMKSASVLPDEGFDTRMVDIFSDYVSDKKKCIMPVYCVSKKPGSKAHRIFVICVCGKHVPFGRMGQHWKACPNRTGD